MVIEVIATQNKIDVIGTDGSVVQRVPKKPGIGFVYFLKWTAGGWRISALKQDAAHS